MADPRIAVQIAAVDGFSATMSKFRRELTTTSGAIRALKTTDLPDIGRQIGAQSGTQSIVAFEQATLRSISTLRALSSGGGLGGLARFAGLGAAGAIGAGVAGLAQMTSEAASANLSLRNTARMAGTSAEGLNGLRGAAVLTGVSANTADQAMLGLNRTLGEAAFGRNMQAANVMRNLGIDFGSAATGARRAADVFPEVVQQVQRLAQTDPRAAARLLDILGMPGDILPLAMRGAEGIAALTRQAERLSPATKDMAAASDRYTEAQGRLSLSATGLRNALVVNVEPGLSLVMTGLTNIIGEAGRAGSAFDALKRKLAEGSRLNDNGPDTKPRDEVRSKLSSNRQWMYDHDPAYRGETNTGRRREENDPDWRQDVYDQLSGSSQFLYRHLQGSRGNYNANTSTGLSRYYNQATPGENLRAGLSAAGPAGPITPGSTALPNAPADKSAFVQRFGRAAQIMAEGTGTAAPFWLGQWAQEGGWGKSTHGNNPGNIKAGGSWKGDTIRQADGLLYRAYPTIEEGARDQAALIRNSARYRDVLNKGNDMEGAARALGNSGYAEDPNYGAHVLARVKALGAVTPAPSTPTAAAGAEGKSEEPDLTRGGRLPSLATPEAPRPAAVSDQGGSTVRIHLSADNLPQGMNVKTGVEGSGAEMAGINIRRAMPGAGG